MAAPLLSVRRMETDDRIPLSHYFRMASHLINQAKIYRDEHNTIDLYATLLKYTSLLAETIPQHRSYPLFAKDEKLFHKKVMDKVAIELKTLRPMVQLRVAKSNGGTSGILRDNFSQTIDQKKREASSVVEDYGLSSFHIDQCQRSNTDAMNKLSVARIHSSEGKTTAGDTGLASFVTVDAASSHALCGSPCLTSVMNGDRNINVHIVRQPCPSPVLSCIQKLPDDEAEVPPKMVSHDMSGSQGIQTVHISMGLMHNFLALAQENTENNLETCGVLGAFLRNNTYFVTCLIIPKQKSTSDSCQTINEEELYAIQDERSLFPLGWIHTHPSQSCFMSSVDLHTHYSYQVMLPEAIAIVMAPTDSSRSYGIFRLTEPTGTAVLRKCQMTGFHLHESPDDGNPIYEDCSHVYMNPNLRFEIIDIR